MSEEPYFAAGPVLAWKLLLMGFFFLPGLFLSFGRF